MGKLNQTVPEYMGKRYDWATRKPDSSILADMPTPLLSSAVEDEVEGGEGVGSMRPEHVGPFLEERLRWRAVFHGFDRRDPRAEGLQLRIGVSAKVHHDGGGSRRMRSMPRWWIGFWRRRARWRVRWWVLEFGGRLRGEMLCTPFLDPFVSCPPLLLVKMRKQQGGKQ